MTDFTPMTPEAAQEWCDWLDNNHDKKGKGQLCDGSGKMCCLGALAKINGTLKKRGSRFYVETPRVGAELGIMDLTSEVQLDDGAFGLAQENQRVLIAVNDDPETLTFAPVIAKIEELFIDGAETQLTRRNG